MNIGTPFHNNKGYLSRFNFLRTRPYYCLLSDNSLCQRCHWQPPRSRGGSNAYAFKADYPRDLAKLITGPEVANANSSSSQTVRHTLGPMTSITLTFALAKHIHPNHHARQATMGQVTTPRMRSASSTPTVSCTGVVYAIL